VIVQHDLLLQFQVAFVSAAGKLDILLVFFVLFSFASFIILGAFIVLLLLESNVKVATVGLTAVGLAALLSITGLLELCALYCGLLLLLVVFLFLVKLPVAATDTLVAGSALLFVVVPLGGLSVVLVSLLSHRQLN
jgi:hypothetical protein